MNDCLVQNSEYFINLYYDEKVRNNITGLSKSLGEAHPAAIIIT